jgi:hypothetical protein
MQSFKEFLNLLAVKPQTTLLKQKIGQEMGLNVSKDMSQSKKPISRKLRNAVKAATPPSPISAVLRKQRLTNPENRFKVRKGSNLDNNASKL